MSRSGVTMMRCSLLVVAIIIACVSTQVAARTSPLARLLSDDSMPYDMSGVAAMERAAAAREAAEAQREAQAYTVTQHVPATHQISNQQQQQLHAVMETGSNDANLVQIHDAMSAREQSFFDEKSIDSFLEQRAAQKAQLETKAKALAQQRAQAAHAAAVKASAEAQVAADIRARQILKMKAQLVQQQAIHEQQAAQLQQQIQMQLQANAAAKAKAESEARAAAEIASHAVDVFHTEFEERAHSEEDAEADAEADVEELNDEKLLAEEEAKEKAEKKQKEEQVALLETQAAQKASTQLKKPWWSSKQGVQKNYHHYAQGVKNSLLPASGQVSNALGAYSLPLGKRAAAKPTKEQPASQAAPALIESAAVSVSKQAPTLAVPVSNAGYTLQPVNGQGASVSFNSAAAAEPFNPYNGALFHPQIAVPVYAPKLPAYMAESAQPWAGAGYYGSGGGQGPHPGSEAFIPLPGVDGKEFGIRAREAWEDHSAKFGRNPDQFHDAANAPNYPYFPHWSRESEVGGRPDLFPRPMSNLAQVNAHAQAVAADAYRYSQTYYPQYNAPSVTPVPNIMNSDRSSVSDPRLQTVRVGYPVPTAGSMDENVYGRVSIPQSFPQPQNSNTFNEAVNYYPTPNRPTLAIPMSPLSGRNIMINNGPDRGLNPVFGGYPQVIGVPIAASGADQIVATGPQ